MHRCPFLPPSISLPLVGQSSVCTWTRAFARANATGNFAFPLCRLLDKQQRQGGVIHWHRYTGPAASQKTPLIRERPANPPLPLSLSLESPFAKWFSNIGSMYASYVINPREPIVIRAIFRVIRRIARFSNRLPIVSQCTDSRPFWILSTRFPSFFFFIFDSDLPSTRDGIPFPVWIRNREWGCEWERDREQMGRIVSFKDRSLFLKRPIIRQSFPFSYSFPFIFVFLLYEIFDWKIPVSYVPLWFAEGKILF